MASEFANTLSDARGTEYLYKANLGMLTTTTFNQSVTIYVNGPAPSPAPGTATDSRTWYEGIGFVELP